MCVSVVGFVGTALVLVQLTERSLLTSEVPGSNPTFNKTISLSSYRKDKKNESEKRQLKYLELHVFYYVSVSVLGFRIMVSH